MRKRAFAAISVAATVPVSVTPLDIPPRVGDGLTWHGVADHALGAIGQPSYLTTLVTYSSVASAPGVPVELGPSKALAVSAPHWSIPVRPSNVHPVDGGTRQFATGAVAAKTSTGAPLSYRVATGDVTSVAAARSGITVTDLIWLNKNLQVLATSSTSTRTPR